MTSPADKPDNSASGGNGNHAAHNLYSTLLQAGRDINLHQQQALSTDPATREEREAVRAAWVAEDEDGKEITTAPEALAMLERDERVIVIAGPPGTGKTAAGLRALSLLRFELPGDTGVKVRLQLEHVRPDWDSVEKDKFLLPAEPGRGYLLDVSGESARWEKPEATARKFLGHAETLRAKGSYLVVISGEYGWPESDPVLGRNVVRAVSAPPGDRITRHHVEQLYPQVALRGWLRGGLPEADSLKGADSGAGQHDHQESLADLLRADMQPGDAATLALDLSRISDSGGTLSEARDLVQSWRERVSTVFRTTRESADDRALLLSAVMLEGLSPAQVLEGARLLLKDQGGRDIRDILTGHDLVTRLETVQARSSGQRVTFSHLPGYPAAVLRHFWCQISDVQSALLDWVRPHTTPQGLGAGRIQKIADLLAQLAVDEGDLRPLEVTPAWAAAGCAGQEGASRLLARVARDPTLGQEARTRLRSWAGNSADKATVAAVACQGDYSLEYPRQALTCLRWVLGRAEPDTAVSTAAERALRVMGSNPRLLPRVWATVQGWLTEYTCRDDRQLFAARRAVLALFHPDAARPAATLLLANASEHPDTAKELVQGWCAALAVPDLEAQCEDVLTAWAEAVTHGALDADAVVRVLNDVIREHWMTGPLATFLAGRAGTEHTPQSIVDLRKRLILRLNNPPQFQPEPDGLQPPEPSAATPHPETGGAA